MSDFKGLFGDWEPDERPEGEDKSKRQDRRNSRECEVRVVDVYEGVYDSSGRGGEGTYFVLLRDNHNRELKIFLVRDVAMAIFMAIQNKAPDRPFTHDLLRNVIDKLGGKVERVIVDDLMQDTFYARILVEKGKETIEIDSRPSDAIALALRFRAPIYVAESVLEDAQGG